MNWEREYRSEIHDYQDHVDLLFLKTNALECVILNWEVLPALCYCVFYTEHRVILLELHADHMVCHSKPNVRQYKAKLNVVVTKCSKKNIIIKIITNL